MAIVYSMHKYLDEGGEVEHSGSYDEQNERTDSTGMIRHIIIIDKKIFNNS